MLGRRTEATRRRGGSRLGLHTRHNSYCLILTQLCNGELVSGHEAPTAREAIATALHYPGLW